MSRRLFAAFTLPAAALFGCLLTAAPAAAGQGWNLYSWSGGAPRNFAPEGYPIANAPYGYPAAGAPVAGYPAAYGPVYAPAPASPRPRREQHRLLLLAGVRRESRRRQPRPHPHRPSGRRGGPFRR